MSFLEWLTSFSKEPLQLEYKNLGAQDYFLLEQDDPRVKKLTKAISKGLGITREQVNLSQLSYLYEMIEPENIMLYTDKELISIVKANRYSLIVEGYESAQSRLRE